MPPVYTLLGCAARLQIQAQVITMFFGGPCRCRLRSRDRSFGLYSIYGALSFSTDSMREASRRELASRSKSVAMFSRVLHGKMAQLSWSEEQSRATRLDTTRHASRKADPSTLHRKAASMAEVPCCLVSRLEHWTRLPAEQRTVLVAPLMT